MDFILEHPVKLKDLKKTIKDSLFHEIQACKTFDSFNDFFITFVFSETTSKGEIDPKMEVVLHFLISHTSERHS